MINIGNFNFCPPDHVLDDQNIGSLFKNPKGLNEHAVEVAFRHMQDQVTYPIMNNRFIRGYVVSLDYLNGFDQGNIEQMESVATLTSAIARIKRSPLPNQKPFRFRDHKFVIFDANSFLETFADFEPVFVLKGTDKHISVSHSLSLEKDIDALSCDSEEELDACVPLHDGQRQGSYMVPLEIAQMIAERVGVELSPTKAKLALQTVEPNSDFICHIQHGKTASRTEFGWVSTSMFDRHFRSIGLNKKRYFRKLETERINEAERRVDSAIQTLTDTLRGMKADHYLGHKTVRDDTIGFNASVSYGARAVGQQKSSIFVDKNIQFLTEGKLKEAIRSVYERAAEGRDKTFRCTFDDGSIFAIEFRRMPKPS